MRPNAITVSRKPTPQVSRTSLAPDEFLTTKGLMRLLKIKHRQTIYNLIAEGLPVIPLGRNFRFIKSEAIHFLKQVSRSKLLQRKRNEKNSKE